MTAVGLQITSPTNNAAFTGTPSVTFRGQTQVPPELSGVALFYRWYSSLFAATENRYSLNVAALSNPDVNTFFTLGVGSHAITLAASDRSGEAKADQNATQHGGVAGGAGACVVHVFKANCISPFNGALVSRANVSLVAEAPLKWGTSTTGNPPYQPDAGYHQINRLRYRWVFTPQGAPAGRPTVTLIPTVQQMSFDPSASPPVLRFQTSLAAAVDGAYTLTLFVEDKDTTQHIGSHQVSISVTVTV